jgi:hypothetical protein
MSKYREVDVYLHTLMASILDADGLLTSLFCSFKPGNSIRQPIDRRLETFLTLNVTNKNDGAKI